MLHQPKLPDHFAVIFPIMCALTALLAPPAFAEAETQIQATARTNVEVRAAQVGAAGTEAQAIKDQATLMPAVKEAVAAGAGKALLERTTNPSVAADIAKGIRPKLVRRSEGRPPNRIRKPAIAARARAHAAGCWNDAWGSVVEWNPIAWLYVHADGWCGDSYSIYWYGGASFYQWTWGIYCFAGNGHDYSWDYYPSWIHMANWGTLGVSYPWGCFGVSGGKATERIAANGYWDFYDDYQF